MTHTNPPSPIKATPPISRVELKQIIGHVLVTYPGDARELLTLAVGDWLKLPR